CGACEQTAALRQAIGHRAAGACRAQHRSSFVMPKPVVAIPADIREIEGNVWQATPNQYVRAAVKGAGVIPLLVPALETGHDFDEILDRVDGVLVSGSRTNVHPSHYGREATEADGPFDPAR